MKIWQMIKEQIQTYKYIFVASTDSNIDINGSDSDAVFDDTTVNTCGITNTHSFPVIDVVPLYAPNK